MGNLTKNEIQRRWRPIFWGLVLVLAAAILILDGAGVRFGYGINAWRIIFGVLLLAWLVSAVIRRQFADLFIPLGILFLVFEAPIAKAVGRESGKLLPTWTVIVAMILITIGMNMILRPANTVSVSGDDKAKSKTIKKLKSKKKYYVHIRRYKKVNGVKLYSAWSAVKAVKVK